MSRKQKLELTWIGKDEQPKLEPRILMEVPEKSYHAATRRTPDDQFDNLLIHGDNLLALKALEQEYTGKVKCIYIDPPFNTQQALDHYDDGIEHSLWLSLMRDRIKILHTLLTSDGTLFIHIDDNEIGYLIAITDEIFGRKNRISIITFKQGAPTGHKSINPGVVSTSNYILIYSKDKKVWNPNRVYTKRADRDTRYNQFIKNINECPSKWSFTTLRKAFSYHTGIDDRLLKKHFGIDYDEELNNFVIEHANSVIRKARPDYSAVGNEVRSTIDISSNKKDTVILLKRENHPDMYFIGGERILFYSDKLKKIDGILIAGEPLTTIWDDLLSNNLHNEGGVEFPRSKKPEALVKRCLELTTMPGDLILDSFLGSGTTAAVAHKMKRRWIGIELGEHCYSLCHPRLKRVVDGEDPGGITSAVDWKGGGGFRFCELGPSLIRQDAWGNPVINAAFNPEMLAEALCKLEGFRYAPHPETFWMQGQSSESDFIYVTTQYVTAEMLAKLSAEVGNDRTLLLCCSAHDEASAPNITLRKIPNAVLQKCEWGKDDYSLSISSLPAAPPEDDEAESAGGNAAPARPARAPRGGRAANPRDDKARLQPSLFDLAPGDDA